MDRESASPRTSERPVRPQKYHRANPNDPADHFIWRAGTRLLFTTLAHQRRTRTPGVGRIRCGVHGSFSADRGRTSSDLMPPRETRCGRAIEPGRDQGAPLRGLEEGGSSPTGTRTAMSVRERDTRMSVKLESILPTRVKCPPHRHGRERAGDSLRHPDARDLNTELSGSSDAPTST